MSFLRSVIADARTHGPVSEPSDAPSARSGRVFRGLDGDISGGGEKYPNSLNQTDILSTLPPLRKDASEYNVGDAPASQADTPVNRGMPNSESNTGREVHYSAPVVKSESIPDEESHTRLDTGNLPSRVLDLEREKMSEAEGHMTLQPAGTVLPNSMSNSTMDQDHDPSIASPETHSAQNSVPGHEETAPVSSSASIGDTPGKGLISKDENSATVHLEEEGAMHPDVHEAISSVVEQNAPAQAEADATQIASFAPPRRSHQIDLNVSRVFLTSSGHPPDFSRNPAQDTAASAVSPDAGTNWDLQHPGESRVDDPLGPVAVQASTPDNSAGRNKARKSLADGGKASQALPGIDQRADKKSPSNQANIQRHQQPDKPKNSRRAVLSDYAVPRPSKPGNPKQQIAKAARPTASPKALLSVPARPFQTDSMPPKADYHTFPSMQTRRVPEKNNEGPKVQIGHIDVIIEAPIQPAARPSTPPSSIDLASRHYLRRL